MTERIPAALLATRTDQTVVAGWRDPTLQRISDALRAGLTWYVSGSIKLAEASRVVRKLQAAFPQLTRDKRHSSRQGLAGLPRYKLIVFANRSAGEALFWLMTSQPIDTREKWRDATASRTRLTCYQWEAVQQTKAGASAPVWTWAMSSESLARIKDEIRDAIRHGRPTQAVALGNESATWPGFAAVRIQRTALAHLFAGEWTRTRRDDPPKWPRLRYVQRLKTR